DLDARTDRALDARVGPGARRQRAGEDRLDAGRFVGAEGRRLPARRLLARTARRLRHRQQADRLRPHLVGDALGLAVAGRAQAEQAIEGPGREREEEDVGSDERHDERPQHERSVSAAMRSRHSPLVTATMRPPMSTRSAPSAAIPAATPATSPFAATTLRPRRTSRAAKRSANAANPWPAKRASAAFS